MPLVVDLTPEAVSGIEGELVQEAVIDESTDRQRIGDGNSSRDDSGIPTSTPIRCSTSVNATPITDTSSIEITRGRPDALFGTVPEDFLTDTVIQGVFGGSVFSEDNDDIDPERRFEADMTTALERSRHDVGGSWGECGILIMLGNGNLSVIFVNYSLCDRYIK